MGIQDEVKHMPSPFMLPPKGEESVPGRRNFLLWKRRYLILSIIFVAISLISVVVSLVAYEMDGDSSSRRRSIMENDENFPNYHAVNNNNNNKKKSIIYYAH